MKTVILKRGTAIIKNVKRLCLKTFIVSIMLLMNSLSSFSQWKHASGPTGQIGCIAVNGQYVFVADGGSIFFSSNDGTSWSATANSGLPSSPNIRTLAGNRTNLFAAIDNHGIYTTANNGASWTPVNSGFPTSAFCFAVNGANVFAGGMDFPGGIYKSTNNGVSWTNVYSVIPYNPTVLAVNDTNVFAGYDDRILLSTDNGTSWISYNNGLINSNITSFAIDKSANTIYAGTKGGGVHFSNSKFPIGASWSPINTGLKNLNITALAVRNFNGVSEIFAGTDTSGVFISTNGGLNWEVFNFGLTDIHITSIAVNGTILYAGTKSSGVFTYDISNLTNIWPGDANSDLVANNFDLLPIGIGYGSTGPVRSAASNNWVAQSATDWSSFFANGVNYKHSDCNGDGTINVSDTTAIMLNYGLTHNKTEGTQKTNSANPDLYLAFVNDTIPTSTTFTVGLYLGNSTTAANNVYGGAFTVNYNPKLIKAGSAKINFNSSWLGTIGTNMIAIQKDFPLDGKLDIGVTRIDHQNVSGSGQIGTLSFTMDDDISGKNYLYKKLILSLSNTKLISKDETVIPVNLKSDSVVASMDITGIHIAEAINSVIKIYPNPSKGLLNIDLGGVDVTAIGIFDILGQNVWSMIDRTAQKQQIDLSNLTSGTYFINIQSKKTRIVKRVSLVK